MKDLTKLLFALQQVDNITELVKGNPYEKFLCSHLISLRVELQRQLQFAKL
jgi:hypothetical protein